VNELTASFSTLQPHVLSIAVVSARLLPVAFLCPLLGGQQAPTHVKLGVVLALAFFLHLGCGVGLPADAADTLVFVGLAIRELLLGTTLGLLASLPFDTARMGGRFVDLFRGSSAEAALPLAGSREAASADLLFQLLLALCATGVAMPLVLAAVVHSYAWAPPGAFTHTREVAFEVATLVCGAFSTALAIAGPIAGVALALDTLLAFASRASSGMNLQEIGAPAKILAGGAVLWLMVGVIAARLELLCADLPETLRGLLVLGTAR
jgi:flagellar biosynthetic protein FliR/type III secretion protein T